MGTLYKGITLTVYLITLLSVLVLGEFSNVKDANVNAPAYEGAVMQCSNIAYKPGLSRKEYFRTFKPYAYNSIIP